MRLARKWLSSPSSGLHLLDQFLRVMVFANQFDYLLYTGVVKMGVSHPQSEVIIDVLVTHRVGELLTKTWRMVTSGFTPKV